MEMNNSIQSFDFQQITALLHETILPIINLDKKYHIFQVCISIF
jgi:hypothetical protein